ncbi:MAG: hypothetical protein FJ144_27825 [Deltaproteobacteria bacterium]|nr:hypothetical protein [Deltaproteobacteria bacterium]
MAREWWRRLAAAERREYERSESISRLVLPNDPSFAPMVHRVEQALAADDRAGAERAAQALVDRICIHVQVPRVAVSVLGKRPADGSGELHGIYHGNDESGRDTITVWMRTAKRKDVVAPRTFLRTLLHEVAHHLDIRALGLPSSFHSKGFYQRESSLMRTITRGTSLAPRRAGARDAAPADSEPREPPPADPDARRRGLEILRNAADAIAARTRRRDP